MNYWLTVLVLALTACVVDPGSSNLGVSSVAVTPATVTLEVGAKQTLAVVLKNAAGGVVIADASWSSSDAAKASVNPATGEVVGVTEGGATITASSNGKTGSSGVTVQDNRVANVTVTSAASTVSVNGGLSLSAAATNAVGRTLGGAFTWTSSDPGLATVGASGLVMAKAAGKVTITAALGGKTGSLELTVVVPTLPSQRQTKKSLMSGTTRVRFWQYLPEEYDASTATYPLLVFLHGAGETSQNDDPTADPTEYDRVLVHGPPKLVKANNDLCFTVSSVKSCFIVLTPQAPKSDGWWNNARVRSLLDYAKANLRVDPSRVYLTGLSMGGGGSWNFASAQNGAKLYGDELAAIVPIAGASGVSSATCNMADSHLPVWAFHGTADSTVLPQSSRDFVNAVNGVKVGSLQCTANPTKALLTEYPGVGHDSWTRTYDPVNRFNPVTAQPDASGINIYEWLLQHHR